MTQRNQEQRAGHPTHILDLIQQELDGSEPHRGSLSSTRVTELLQLLRRTGATGALQVWRGGVRKTVWLRDGEPVSASSNLPGERLGAILLKEGLLSEAEHDVSLRRALRQRRRHGEVLVEMGRLSPQNLEVGLELQLRSRLRELCGWREGEFVFRRDVALPSSQPRLDGGLASIIAEDVLGWPEGELLAALAPCWERYLAPSEDERLRGQDLSLDEEQLAFLASVDGRRTVRQVVEDAAISQTQALALIQAGLAAGLLDTTAEPQLTPALARASTPDPLVAQLTTQLAVLRRRSPLGILGVAAGWSDLQVRQRYARLAAQFDPCRFRGESEDVRALIAEISGLLLAAYNAVATAAQRRSFQGTPELAPTEMAALPSLDAVIDRARASIAAGRWQHARWLLDHAVQLRGERAEAWALRGWAIFNAGRAGAQAVADASADLRRALQMDAGCEEALRYVARIRAHLAAGVRPIRTLTNPGSPRGRLAA